jgi:4-carboxymuconolactone decarboxylase
MARLMSERIDGSRLVILEGQKHSVLSEVPGVVAHEIIRFLRGAGDRADAVGGDLMTTVDDGRFEQGMEARRAVLGAEYVNRALNQDGPLDKEFQRFITEYCWGAIWTDDRMPRRDRSLLTLAMTGALGRMDEFRLHLQGAKRNGVTTAELAALIKQITVYCGVPAGVSCMREVRQAFNLSGKPGSNSEMNSRANSASNSEPARQSQLMEDEP